MTLERLLYLASSINKAISKAEITGIEVTVFNASAMVVVVKELSAAEAPVATDITTTMARTPTLTTAGVAAVNALIKVVTKVAGCKTRYARVFERVLDLTANSFSVV